ncbi:ribosomal protein S18-alanine N-acetyltransferase [Prochlorococcus marinus]|uniref:ribosomal protein S18-alanine N-acetyltransferase n=1 Tax=Prochlorococcus marinus TaxID=1219 RepID=UPI001ADCC841|nr:ribosomal protein S18-alanine N-acetyltransferase [Prochlorococcus marinus]MBO8217453.1 ribosomal protein S18-alanine N-acetyltransferase [Prochlorococcus marinus XMU1405]MBW3040668.1 ribosomal-protein-alanine N-acetyltransferase [Prochlorococcus marinus str. MU1405]MBW3048125.1 ribosomal-protein-alanine N-acetyltransferase [Prochlorococcus marinus str. MU1406]
MISIKHIKEKDIDLCYELDSNTISLWSKNQWAKEFKKDGVNVFGILLSNLVVGICVFHVVLDEAQINFFVVNHKYRKKGFGTYLMSYLIEECEKLNLKKLILEVSHSNFSADKFYNSFDFNTVGIRRDYYKDGSDALLKEKKLRTK